MRSTFIYCLMLVAALLSGCTAKTTLKGHVVDPLNGTITDAAIVIKEGKIASITPCEVAADAPFYMPGWVDAHVHIESSMMLPTEFARIAKRHGTIAVIADPHEIANVLGVPGVELMLDDAKKADFYFAFMAPSCVPACSADIETSGAVLDVEDVKALLAREDIYGLGEMMNFPGVLSGDSAVMAKIEACLALGKQVDGHAPGLLGEARMQYAAAGITTDHECSTIEEARAAVAAGMFVQIREGSAALNYNALHPILGEAPELAMFATDDAHPTDLLLGHIDDHVRTSLALGYPLMNILQAASVNPIRHYKLPCGLLQVGDAADLIAISDTTPKFRVLETYIKGVKHKEEGIRKKEEGVKMMNVCVAKPISVEDIVVNGVNGDNGDASLNGGKVHQIVAEDCSLLTEHYVGPLDEESNKIVNYNRYTEGARPSVGYIRGFKMRRGAFAQTIAHDCHNIMAIGANDEDLVRVINRVIELGGGIVATDGEITQELALPIAGLISPLPAEELDVLNLSLERLVQSCGCEMDSPFITLGFMALPVIPCLKQTDKGLFDATVWHVL